MALPGCNGQTVNLMTDVNHCGSCTTACAPGQLCTLGACTGGTNHQYVVNRVLLPLDNIEYAADLDGDGKLDDRFGNFLINLSAYTTISIQNGVDALTSSGEAVLLLDWPTVNVKDPVTIFQGVPTTKPPNFTKIEDYQIDSKILPAKFPGPISQGVFNYTAPSGPPPPIIHLLLRLNYNGQQVQVAFQIPLQVHHIKLVDKGPSLTDLDGGVGEEIVGVVQGSIMRTDLEKGLVAGLATYLTEIFKVDLGVANKLQPYIDLGGCTNPDGTMALGGDFKVDICEVLTSPLEKDLAPDLRVHDKYGHFGVQPKNLAPLPLPDLAVPVNHGRQSVKWRSRRLGPRGRSTQR